MKYIKFAHRFITFTRCTGRDKTWNIIDHEPSKNGDLTGPLMCPRVLTQLVGLVEREIRCAVNNSGYGVEVLTKQVLKSKMQI